MILEGHYISEVVDGCSDRSSGCRLGCDRVRPMASSRVSSELIHEACGILNEVRVNLAWGRGDE